MRGDMIELVGEEVQMNFISPSFSGLLTPNGIELDLRQYGVLLRSTTEITRFVGRHPPGEKSFRCATVQSPYVLRRASLL